MTNNSYTIKLCLWEETPNKVHLYIQDTHSINTKQNHIYRGWFINYGSALKHTNCYALNNFSLIESGDDEKVYNNGSLKICKYYEFSKIIENCKK